MKVGLYEGVEAFKNDYDYSAVPILFEIDKAEMFDVLRFRGKVYVVVMLNHKVGFAGAREITISPESEPREYEHNVICPFCGWENLNSWELSDSSDEDECGRCGAVISYQREVTVEYTTSLVKAPTIIDVPEARAALERKEEGE